MVVQEPVRCKLRLCLLFTLSFPVVGAFACSKYCIGSHASLEHLQEEEESPAVLFDMFSRNAWQNLLSCFKTTSMPRKDQSSIWPLLESRLRGWSTTLQA